MKENPKQTNRKVILSQKKPMPMKYRVIKVEQLKQIKKKKIDAASTAVQSQKKADDVAPKVAATVNKKRNDRKSSYTSTSKNSNTNTTSDNGDKYKNVAKMNMFQKTASSETIKQHTVSSETHNKKAEKMAVNTSANSAFNTEIANNSIKRENIQSRTVSDASNLPSSQTANYKAKAAEISKKMMADMNKARSQTDAYERSMKAYAIQQARNEYKKTHLSPNMSKRFRSAAQRMEAKAVNTDPNFNKYKKQATIHYKKMVKYDRVSRRLGNKIAVKEQKTERNEKILKVVKGAATLATNPVQFAKNAAEEQLRKSKIADTAFKISGDIKTFEAASKADSLANGTSAAMTALPEKYVKTAVKDKVTNVLTGRDKTNKLKKKKAKADRKYGREARKAERAERKANRAKEAVRRNAKLKWYKEKKGLSKTGEIVKDIKKSAKKVGINILGLMVKAVKKGAAAVIAAVGPAFFVLLILLMVISALFTWITPHEENFYVEEDNAWEPVMVESNDEILKGYIKHIQDYFDKKQLEILSKVDFEFGGFEPDKYEWEHTENNPNAIEEDVDPKFPVETKGYYISVKKAEYTMEGSTPGDRYTPSKPIWSTEPTITTTHHADAKGSNGSWDESWRVMHEEYYKINEDYGYEMRTTSEDYDYVATYLDYSVDVAGFWNSIEQIKEDKYGTRFFTKDVYRCELITGEVVTEGGSDVGNLGILGHIARDISGYTLRLYKNDSMIYNGDYADYLKSHPELFMHVENVPAAIYFGIFSDGENSQISYGTLRPATYELSYITRNRTDIAEDLQYIPDRHIWNLNEYGNRWIKLSDDCDFEHIIAMAAVKKWQDISSDDFDQDTYRFEITDEDLDYCLGKLYEFSYSYRAGQCQYANCQRGGDPPHVYCNRASTHKHLIGKVTNLQVAGGIDYVLNRILKIPVRSDFSSDEEYQTAMNDFETCKDIYQVYAEYISDELGTSTKLADYENDSNAQYRLLRMYQATNGKAPSNPPKNVKISSYKKQAAPITTSEAAVNPGAQFYEHYYITIQWDAPDAEYISKDETVEITNYDIYEIDRSKGKRTLIARVGSDQTSVVDLDIGSGKTYNGRVDDTVTVGEQQISIVIQSVNDHGNSCDSKIATRWLK